MMRRRLLLGAPAALAALAGAGTAGAQSRAERKGQQALRVGADGSVQSLANALLRGFGAYSGLAARLDVAPSANLLEAIERGEIDAALTLAPDVEARLQKQGLLHDRRSLGQLDLLLVGPTDAGIARGRDAAEALRRVAASGMRFVGRNDGSGLHFAEQALWRAAGVAPAAPWYLPADSAPLAQARVYRACVLVEGSAWAPGPLRDRFGVLAEADPRLQAPVHVLRSFRATHSAGKLFVAWASGDAGRRVLAEQRVLRPSSAAR